MTDIYTDDTQPDVDFFAALWNADGSSKHAASEEVAQVASDELPEEVIVDGQYPVGSTVPFKGQDYTVTLCEETTAADYAEDTRNEVEGLSIGWHSWLKKKVV